MLRDLSSRQHGFALVSVSLLLGIMFIFTVVLADTVLSGRRAERAAEQDFEANTLAQAGIEKAIFCLNATSGTACGGTFGSNYAGETDLAIGNGTVTTTVTGSGSSREVVSVATPTKGGPRTIAATLTTIPSDDDMDFSYALQAGDGGAYMENNSEINGTLYTNGDVECQSTQADVLGDVFVSKVGGVIDSCHIGYHAHADSILDSEVEGDAYYLSNPSGIAGTDVDGTEYPGSARPDVEPLPTVDLDFWREAAEEGGTVYGNQAPADGATIGPLKIVGNLTLNQNVDITLAGPLWVQGDVDLQNNTSITLDAAYGDNSSVILIDKPGSESTSGRLIMVPNVALVGSGSSKSHIAVVSTNSGTVDTDPAIQVRNNSSGAIFYSTDGTIRIYNNAGAKALAGHRLYIDNGATVTYVESDLADLNFSNSPGGIWRLQAGTWRVVK